jgi:hypothetical protein
MLWLQTILASRVIGPVGMWLTGLLGVSLAVAVLWFGLQIRASQRGKFVFKPWRICMILPWAVLALFWWGCFYTTSLLPFSFPDIWPREVHIVMVFLEAWVAFSVVAMLLPRTNRESE